MPPYTRTRTGCFTCREDGYKCDEQKPHCGRCLRLGKTCKGYGVRLKWHTLETPATAKTTNRSTTSRMSRKSPGTASTTTGGSASSRSSASPIGLKSPQSLLVIKRSPSYIPSDIRPEDLRLLDHWTSLATVISMGTGGENPFLVHLTPMIMQSEALRAVVCSMAASHLAVLRDDRSFQTVALQQRLLAASRLRQTIEFSDAEPTLAAILMLQVSDRLFATDTRIDHLAGAKAVVTKRGKFADWTGSRAQFLLSLCYYHDVLSSISRGTSPLFDFDDSLPVEGLSCMLDLTKVLRLVSQISGMVGLGPEALDVASRHIEEALGQVSPDPPVEDEVHMDAVAHTTLAYKHAAFIYLYRAWRNIGAPHPLTKEHIEKTLHHLGCVPSSAPIISAHVWPTWTAGCEAMAPHLRQFVLERFDQMYEARHFPSLVRTKSDIQDVWLAKDAQRELSGVDSVDCIKVILQQRQREADLA
ncbi:fungal-specific transcription factor domain-containing protein [Apiospora saccharicola]